MSGISLARRPSIRFGALCSEQGSTLCPNDRNAVTDLGRDPNAALGALLTYQVDGVHEIFRNQVAMIRSADHIRTYHQSTAATAVVQGEMNQDHFTDPGVMLALRRTARRLRNGECGATPPRATIPMFRWSILNEWISARSSSIRRKRRNCWSKPAPRADWNFRSQTRRSRPGGLEVLRIVVEDWDETGFNLSIQTLPVSVFWRCWTVYPLRFMEWGTALSE